MGSVGNQATRHEGQVKCWVGNTYGFIRWVCSAGIQRTTFFHISQMPHYIRMRSRVSFELHIDNRGREEAIRVVPLDDQGEAA
jgi:hypothetical protein